ncbi:hypothetical protein [Faecalibacter macacae]|uniref:Uncharacterized protein n=1 Tax=Faecalibacter macacae TaxID=1859289 RepID=A0A3L9MDV7_9FLAO|nr:hypothetical protein [Faecalibacter macacae]RLZ08749.1 hypothetical protein EAH69_09515 [Faecalibacter macacae]
MKYLFLLIFTILTACNSNDQMYKEAVQGTWIMIDNPNYLRDNEMEEPIPEPMPPFRNPVYSFEGDSIYNSASYWEYNAQKYPKESKMNPIMKIEKVSKDTIFSETRLLVRQKVNRNLLDYDEIRFSETYYNGATVRVKFSLKKNGSIQYKTFRYDDLIRNETAQVNKAYLKINYAKSLCNRFYITKKS